MLWNPRDPVRDAPPLAAILHLTVLFVLLGLGWMAYGWYTSWSLQRVRSWQTTTGRVVKVEVRNPISRRSSRGNVRITYTYRVWGKTYTSDRYSPVSRTAPFEAQHHYRPGQLVRVYFDPDHPQRSVLVPYNPSPVPAPVWRSLGLFFILMAPIFALITWASSRLFPYSFGRWRF